MANLSKWQKHCFIEIFLFPVALPLLWSVLHLFEGFRPLVTEFECGGVLAVVMLRIYDFFKPLRWV